MHCQTASANLRQTSAMSSASHRHIGSVVLDVIGCRHRHSTQLLGLIIIHEFTEDAHLIIFAMRHKFLNMLWKPWLFRKCRCFCRRLCKFACCLTLVWHNRVSYNAMQVINITAMHCCHFNWLQKFFILHLEIMLTHNLHFSMAVLKKKSVNLSTWGSVNYWRNAINQMLIKLAGYQSINQFIRHNQIHKYNNYDNI